MLNSCSINKSDVDSYIDKFYNEKSDFDKIITYLSVDGDVMSRIGYSVNKNNLNKNLQSVLNKLDITDISTSSSDCEGVVEFQLEANWTTWAHIYFAKNECNYEQTKKRFYSQSSSSGIEVYGLGDNWLMWIDYDLL